MENKVLKILEYDKILKIISECCVSIQAKKDILESEPCFELKQAESQQIVTEQAILLREFYRINPVYALDEIDALLNKAEVGITLLPADFIKIAHVLKSANSAKKSIMQCGDDVDSIKEYVTYLTPDMMLVRHIETTIGGENEIRDSASDLLRTLRRKIVSLNNKLKDKLNSYTHSVEYGKYLQDNIITVREGRFVLPLRAEYKGSIRGLIHDRSSSGSTIYVEPFPIVELNNELKTLQLSERDEIERILKALTSEVAAVKDEIRLCYEQLIKLDIIFAKASFSRDYKCVRPILNDKGIVRLNQCRHPLIASDRVVPIDIGFGEKENIVVITGPNTGGKTVSLKTVGLFSLLAFSGIQLPCEQEAYVPIFDNIFCDLGDDQSIAQSLSTFSSHITNIASITHNVTENSLVLIDEIGAGTDPTEGAALAIGIIKYLELIDCHAIITTHYSELKEYALTSNKLVNACMQFDEVTLKPTYKLIIGLPGVSNALEIAENLGINDFILKNARAALKDEKIQFEKVLMNAERIKSQAVSELEEINIIKENLLLQQQKSYEKLNAINAKLAQINNNAKLETQKIVRKATEKADILLDELKEKLIQADEKALLEAKKLHQKLIDIQYEQNDATVLNEFTELKKEDVKPGSEVIIKSLNLKAIIVSLPDKKGIVTVNNGSMNLKLPITDLAKCVQTQKTKIIKKESKQIKAQENTEEIVPTEEILLIGMTVNEAIEVLEPYILDAANRIPKPILRIVHGKGSGALGKGIQQYCKSNPLIKSFRYGRYGEGESGVTFVEMK